MSSYFQLEKKSKKERCLIGHGHLKKTAKDHP